MVRIGDFESLDPGSIPGKTSFLNFRDYKFYSFYSMNFEESKSKT